MREEGAEPSRVDQCFLVLPRGHGNPVGRCSLGRPVRAADTGWGSCCLLLVLWGL